MATHWDQVYHGRPVDSFKWFEPRPATLPLVLEATDPSSSVIDVGGGTSRLVGELLRRGYDDLTVLDISDEALRAHRTMLGPESEGVDFLTDDVTDFLPHRTWDCWHDRAVFHFLTEPDARRRYVAGAARAVAEGGVVIVATFAEDGPEQCAGLPVCRYSIDTLAAEFRPEFDLVDGGTLPIDPDGDQRPYVYAVLAR